MSVLLLRRAASALVLVFFGLSAYAAEMDPGKLADYVAILFADRAQYIQTVDQLRVQLEAQRREAAAREAAVDAYWRAYTHTQKGAP